MINDNDMTNTGGSVNRGSTALPKFNHLYPILFFSQFIRFCGANKCGGPLSSPDGHIDSIITLEESGADVVLRTASHNARGRRRPETIELILSDMRKRRLDVFASQ